MLRAIATSLALYAVLAKLALALVVFAPATGPLAAVICGPAASGVTGDAPVTGPTIDHCSLCLAVTIGPPPSGPVVASPLVSDAAANPHADRGIVSVDCKAGLARAPPMSFPA